MNYTITLSVMILLFWCKHIYCWSACDAVDPVDVVLVINSNVIDSDPAGNINIKKFLNDVVYTSHSDSSFGLIVYGDIPVIFDKYNPNDYTLFDLNDNKYKIPKINFNHFYGNLMSEKNIVKLDAALDTTHNMLKNSNNYNRKQIGLVIDYNINDCSKVCKIYYEM
eukprot:545247_1